MVCAIKLHDQNELVLCTQLSFALDLYLLSSTFILNLKTTVPLLKEAGGLLSPLSATWAWDWVQIVQYGRSMWLGRSFLMQPVTLWLCLCLMLAPQCAVQQVGGWTKQKVGVKSPPLFFFKNYGPWPNFNIALSFDIPAHLPSQNEQRLCLHSLHCLPVNPDNSIFQYSSLQTEENLMKSQCLN